MVKLRLGLNSVIAVLCVVLVVLLVHFFYSKKEDFYASSGLKVQLKSPNSPEDLTCERYKRSKRRGRKAPGFREKKSVFKDGEEIYRVVNNTPENKEKYKGQEKVGKKGRLFNSEENCENYRDGHFRFEPSKKLIKVLNAFAPAKSPTPTTLTDTYRNQLNDTTDPEEINKICDSAPGSNQGTICEHHHDHFLEKCQHYCGWDENISCEAKNNRGFNVCAKNVFVDGGTITNPYYSADCAEGHDNFCWGLQFDGDMPGSNTGPLTPNHWSQVGR